jgi:hypothetical protein
MKFYHGTSKEKWNAIQKEGVLWGYNTYSNPDGTTYRGYRYTYLTPEIDVAKKHGDTILEIEYEPVGVDGRGIDNYGFNPPENETCWQFSVFVPIGLNNIKRIV